MPRRSRNVRDAGCAGVGPSDVVSALLVDTSKCDRAVIADYLRAYPMPLLERLVAPEAPIR